MNNVNNPADALETEAAEMAIEPFCLADMDDDQPTVEAVKMPLPDGRVREVFVRRLTGKAAITLITDASKAENRLDVPVMKMTRCLVDPSDHSKPLFSDRAALDVVEKRPAHWVANLLAAIHEVNPLIKNV